ncbi:MAG: hypothetical protein QW270_06840 [Candidatus Bathyarchaeia archaeon]
MAFKRKLLIFAVLLCFLNIPYAYAQWSQTPRDQTLLAGNLIPETRLDNDPNDYDPN